LKLIFLISFSFLINEFPCAQPKVFLGQLQKNPEVKGVYVDRIEVIVKTGGKVICTSQTNPRGNFQIKIPVFSPHSLDLYCNAVGLGDVFVGILDKKEDLRKHHVFYFPCLLERNSIGKVACPKCHRSDQVYLVEYGERVQMEKANP
jgi:hypothetical protein